MSTHNICFYIEMDKSIRTMNLVDCGLIKVCAVTWSNTLVGFISRVLN